MLERRDILGYDLLCPRCGRDHGIVVREGHTPDQVIVDVAPCPGWRARVAHQLARALAWLSKGVGQ